MTSQFFSAPRVEVICVGSELFMSRVNSHTVAIGQALARIGLSIAREHVVGDNAKLMIETFTEALRRSDIVLCAGGLGPTFDDVTRNIWSRVLHRPLVLHKELLTDIETKFRARNMVMPPHNKRQAYLITGARALSNPFGTAPGQLLRWMKKIVVLLPGPARELLPMIESGVLPELKLDYPGLFIAQKMFLIFGVAESKIDQIIRTWVSKNKRVNGCDIEHGILASNAIITVKFKVSGTNQQRVSETHKLLSAQTRRILGPLIFGEDNDTFESIAFRLLKQRGKTVAVAESCTGGLVAKLLTDAPGASDVFIEGIVSYHNDSKIKRLGVSKTTLLKFGAVSKQTALEMAVGLRKRANSDIALSITGVAGPTGGTALKPVGLVWIAISTARAARAHEFKFNGDRAAIRQRAAQNALNLLRKELLRGR